MGTYLYHIKLKVSQTSIPFNINAPSMTRFYILKVLDLDLDLDLDSLALTR